jgi:hypothetical protein
MRVACAKLVLGRTSLKQGPNDASHEVRSVVVTSLSWPWDHRVGTRHGARRLDPAGSPRGNITDGARGDITDGPRSTGVAGPDRTSTAGHIETRSAAVRRQRSRRTTASLCRPPRHSASGIRRAAAWVLHAPTLLLPILQLWWSYLRAMLVGLAARLLATVVTSANRPRALGGAGPISKHSMS